MGFMNANCLQFCLTADERRQFQEQGYLVVPDAVDAGDARPADRRRGPSRRPGTACRASAADKLLSFANILPEDEAFVDLIDWPRIFPKVWGILGWNIYVYHTHLDVSPVCGEPAGQSCRLASGQHARQ